MFEATAGLDVETRTALIAGLAGLITGFVGPVVKHWLDRWSLHHRLAAEHQYEERKKLRSLIGNHHGRVLELAEHLNYRLRNLQDNHKRGWLRIDGDYTRCQDYYYFTTTTHRAVALLALLREFQRKAIYIDARIADKTDLLFLKYAKALEWSLTDTKLFDGLDYDTFHATDHLFFGDLHIVCEYALQDGSPLSLKQFQEALAGGAGLEELQPILRFFDGLCADEPRLRWSRLVVLHLLLMSFLNSFGYDIHQSSEDSLRKIAASSRQPRVIQNLETCLRFLGLADSKSGRTLMRALRAANASAAQLGTI